MFQALTSLVTRIVDREARSASKVVWESARTATYAPFVVSTLLVLFHRLDAEHWTAITVATIAADGTKNAVESFFEGLGGVFSRVFGGGDTEADEGDE